MKKKILVLLLSFGLIFSLLGTNVLAAEGKETDPNNLHPNTPLTETEVVVGNTKYYLNDQQEVIYAQVFTENKLIKIKEYYPGIKVENAESNVKSVYYLDGNGYITNAESLKQDSQKINFQYFYYPNTMYGKHEKNISYAYEMTENGFTKTATKYEKGTNQILFMYEYYPNTVFAKRDNNIKSTYEFDKKGYLLISNMREQGTKHIVSQYEYYPETTFEERTKNIMNFFVINSKGYITSSTFRQKGTGKILSKNYYYSKAIYGKHSKKIKSTYNYNQDGFISNSLSLKENSTTLTSAIEYYPKTTMKNRNKNIKHTFSTNSKGAITNGYLKKQGSQTTLGKYTFKSGTKYGNHWSRVSTMNLYLPKIRQNPGLPWGCSVVALTEALNFKGYNLNKVKMAKSMPYSKDPHKGFVGSPFRSQQGDPNLIYPEGLVGLAKKYRPESEVVNEINEAQIKSELQKGNPVLAWAVWNFKIAKWKWYYSGEDRLHAPTEYHVIALSGYSDGKFYYVDTCGHAPVNSVSKNTFYRSFNSLGKRTLIIK